MKPPPLRTYMSHVLLVCICEHKGEPFDHLLRPLFAARKALTGSELRAADARARRAVAELLHGASPPAPAHLAHDGLAAVDCDLYAADMVSIYRERLRKVEEAPNRRVKAAAKAARAKEVRLPYRGVWEEGGAYTAGDFVTRGGSMWHCNTSGTAEKPGKGEDWVLAAKSGRDARDRQRPTEERDDD